MNHLERIIGICLVVTGTLMFGVSASSSSIKAPAVPALYVLDSETVGTSLKHNAQFKKKRRRGPCVSGDAYNKADKSCKGADSASYARGDRAAGRCKAGDRYRARKKVCRTKDKKKYPADMKVAASLADSQKMVKERRMKRRDKRAQKHGCNPGDGWSRRRKMCVHYYPGKK
ncbi:MAG: hypothetical protein ACKVHL_07215 [Rhodospirillales bacterium]|jgi:hypothetical protein